MRTVLQVLQAVVYGYCLFQNDIIRWSGAIPRDLLRQWNDFNSGKFIPQDSDAISMINDIYWLKSNDLDKLLHLVDTTLNFLFVVQTLQVAGASLYPHQISAGLVEMELPTEQELRDLRELLACSHDYSDDRWVALLESFCLVEV